MAPFPWDTGEHARNCLVAMASGSWPMHHALFDFQLLPAL